MNLKSLTPPVQENSGFSLVELMIATAITSIVGLAIGMYYVSHNRAYTMQREMAHMQQNLRAGMYLLQNDIRNAGRDPLRTDKYGIQSIVNSNIDADDPNGYPGLVLTSLTDTDGDGIADEATASQQTVSYQVMDQDGDGTRELRRLCTPLSVACANPGIWDLVLDGIEDIGLAYAYDDGNGDLARIGGLANAPEIWAIDSNNTNDLDTNLDDNGDGDININDGAGAALANVVPLRRIRAVRIWLLARSRTTFTNFVDNRTYVLGRKVLNMNDAANINRRSFRHWLLEGVVALQNYELDSSV